MIIILLVFLGICNRCIAFNWVSVLIKFVMSQQKLWELAKQVSEFLVWRQVICPFDRDRRILQYLVTTPVYTEDGQ